MIPAGDDFQMVIKLVGSAVLNRKFAESAGEDMGLTFQRLAWVRSNRANEWVQRVADDAAAAARLD